MKTSHVIITIGLLTAMGQAMAQYYQRSPDDVYVRGYQRDDGTYVGPHYRSAPDGIKENNYGYRSRDNQGNVFPRNNFNNRNR